VLWHRLRLPVAADWWTPGVDVYHATDFLLPPLSRARGVVTVHDLSFLTVPDRSEPSLRRYLERAVPAAARSADHVVADSKNTRNDLIDGLGLDADRVSVAYPGVSDAFAPMPRETARRYVRERLGVDGPFVLGVGTIEPRKDWPLLIRAYERCLETVRGLSLVIAGADGWGTQATYEAARRAAGRVRLLGRVADGDLPWLYSAALVFAYPSVYEGFGLPAVEALACAAPTVVADASCSREVVGDAAIVVPPGDTDAWAGALVAIAADEPLRSELARRGPERAARYTWARCAEALERVYATVIAT
jgi:glycosyltransferase involved in cell wall biosynthesis